MSKWELEAFHAKHSNADGSMLKWKKTATVKPLRVPLIADLQCWPISTIIAQQSQIHEQGTHQKNTASANCIVWALTMGKREGQKYLLSSLQSAASFEC